MNKLKWISVGIVGSLFAVSHIGMIGYIATREKSKLPDLNVPVGPYTSYKVSVSEEGYAISYKANDPKTAYEMLRSLVGSEMCIRDRLDTLPSANGFATIP